ncbi:MAG: AAA family ATPase, partial [Gemmatimonadota bacterium]
MVYAFDEYELDDALCELRRGGEPYHLEPQVYDVLAYLVRHRDRLVTRDELLDEIWGHHFVTSSALGSRIKDARRALGDDGRAQRMIKTVRGRGYRFLPEVRVHGGESGAGPAVEPDAGEKVPSTETDVDFAGEDEEPTGGWVPSPPGPVSILPASGSGPRVTIPRRVELERLDEAMERARSGARQIVFVSGPSGAGKTVLLDEFLSGSAAEGSPGASDHALVVWGQCLDQSGPGEAYLPLLDALDRLCRADDGGGVVARLASQAPSWAVQMPFLLTPKQQERLARRAAGATRERMLRELVSFVEALAAEVPLVLLVEDLHWSDPSTLDFVRWLARRPEPARLILVATYRGDEKTEDLRKLLGKIRRVPGFVRLELSPWGPSEVEDFLGARFLHHDFPGELANVVLDRTTGNPLFVT